jgi:murein DD-endopeptidase MepM/ murein hydrolase activator NlpD
MRKAARPYFAAFALGALLIPPGTLDSQVSAKPSVAFLVAVQTEAMARNAFGALPGSRLLARQAPAASRILGPARTPAAQVTPTQPSPAATKPSYHVIVSGDTLWTLARRYGTSVAALARSNGLSETATLRLGRRLAVDGTVVVRTKTPASASSGRSSASRPAASRQSVTLTVKSGQTLSDIAQAYGVSTRTLVEANGLRSAHRIREGQRLTIPGRAASAFPSPRTARTTARAVLPPIRAQAPAAQRPLASALRRGFFRWPARGVITSRFGMRWRRHHNGVDIASPRGTPIYAARGGLVSFAGWYYGYGLTVIIDHGAGIISIYGHASSLLVRGGQGVSAGQQIARVGCTGSCTGSHVHFEVRVNGRPVNPLRYL